VTGSIVMFENLKVHFTDTITGELEEYGAIGLAWRDRNLNYCPAGFTKMQYQIYSGVSSMEMTHSIILRLTNDNRMWNDLIHWGYNEDMLTQHNWLSAITVLKFGSSATFILPDMAYLWANKSDIMAGIRNGTYKESIHPYWSDPLFTAPAPSVVAATAHDVDHLKDLLGHHTSYS